MLEAITYTLLALFGLSTVFCIGLVCYLTNKCNNPPSERGVNSRVQGWDSTNPLISHRSN